MNISAEGLYYVIKTYFRIDPSIVNLDGFIHPETILPGDNSCLVWGVKNGEIQLLKLVDDMPTKLYQVPNVEECDFFIKFQSSDSSWALMKKPDFSNYIPNKKSECIRFFENWLEM